MKFKLIRVDGDFPQVAEEFTNEKNHSVQNSLTDNREIRLVFESTTYSITFTSIYKKHQFIELFNLGKRDSGLKNGSDLRVMTISWNMARNKQTIMKERPHEYLDELGEFDMVIIGS